MGKCDSQLLKEAKRGNIEAFESLIEGYESKVYTLFVNKVGDSCHASELAQEVFIRAFQKINTFKENSDFSLWIYTITTSVFISRLNKREGKNLSVE
ncbi:sigma factor [Petroclostridium sp. X23]|uniref:sigma factor n=1 Tax=Petroclostridium sp. X23 TaxID=3045146 RepID=UPI0024ACB7B1|nr:sigma factor [Petroclostridium sp. X23]WHH58629.1 sigma factor [Petroclostridium sp. X23]